MKFFEENEKKEYIFKANGRDLEDRWIAKNPKYYKSYGQDYSIKAFVNTCPKDIPLKKTDLELCIDDFFTMDTFSRTVLAKTVSYDKEDLNNSSIIHDKRRALAAQLDILNDVASNMLPEPLDFFLITNTIDNFTGHAKHLKDKEPVLILDYIPGEILATKLINKNDYSFYRISEGPKSPNHINSDMVIRLAADILAFEMDLYQKGYAYTALSPDHILLLGDQKPRFTGLGRICSIIDDKYDTKHVNYGRQLLGFSAPEFNREDNNFGENESVKSAIAFNLGVLIACIMLGKTSFKENELYEGSYNYKDAKADREKICTALHGRSIDQLICQLTERDAGKRLSEFTNIKYELSKSIGEAKRKKEKEMVYSGTIDWIYNGYGEVLCNGKRVSFCLDEMKYIPKGIKKTKGLTVFFSIKKRTDDSLWVKKFLPSMPPTPIKKWPNKIAKPKQKVQPVKPTPLKPSPVKTQNPAPETAPKPTSVDTPKSTEKNAQVTPNPKTSAAMNQTVLVPKPESTPIEGPVTNRSPEDQFMLTPSQRPRKKKGLIARLFGL